MSQKGKVTKSKKEESSSEKSDGSQKTSKILEPKPKSSSTAISPGKRKSEGSAKGKAKAISGTSSSESSDIDAKKRKKQEKKDDAEGGSLVDALKKSRLATAASVSEFKFIKKRVRLVSAEENLKDDAQGIVYWMSRDQRVEGGAERQSAYVNKADCRSLREENGDLVFLLSRNPDLSLPPVKPSPTQKSLPRSTLNPLIAPDVNLLPCQCRQYNNWAFLYAQRLAVKQKLPLHVVFCLVPKFLDATIRHYGFMLKGLKEVAEDCKELNIPFHLLIGYAKEVLPDFVKEHSIGGVVVDFSPLRVPMQWVKDVSERLPKNVPLVQVDAHNIVPCWLASVKQEYGARTIRRKIHDQLSQFLTEFPPVIKHPYDSTFKAEPIDWEKCYASLEVDRTVKEVEWAKPGSKAGVDMLEAFITQRLKSFGSDRNNPNQQALSKLSPWFHFGQLSVQRAILEVQKYRSKYKESVDSFVEEAVVRRELSDNFCFYNKNYDKVEGAYDWAKNTLKVHETDKRTHIYSLEKLENGKTHDPLWNAAQLQMVHEGKMHGFLRMYWAKKILEWTNSPEEALKFAIYLNDRYELDGRDPNGYVGCMWSICGMHDRAWADRAVFGKIRFMNYQGCKRKFDVAQFERRYHPKNLA